jgi:ABC-type antimicrobial peptide transport system permease subunit
MQVVLSENRARSYFGNSNPADIIGKTIIYNDTIKTTVAGIVKDLDQKATDFHFQEFISLATITKTALKEEFGAEDWTGINSNSQLFIKLKKGTTSKQIEDELPALRKKYRKATDGPDDTRHSLQTLTSIHFNQEYDALGRRAHKPTLYGLLAVAIFLLLIGCINFINLTTAQSALRAKEIGIRKTAGSSKKQLILQFLSETFVLTLIATVLSLVLIPWLLQIFHDFIPPEISLTSFNQPHVWIFLSLLIITVTILSGFYPAWILTKFQPVTVLKNQVHSGTSKTSKAWLRKSLTVTQFVIAQFLIIATLIVSKQIHYSLNKDLGYKKDAIVYISVPFPQKTAFLEKLKLIPEIEKASLGGSPPAFRGSTSSGMKVDNGKKVVETMVEEKNADPAYFDVYKMKLITGKWPEQSDTLREYIINETYAKELGFSNPEQAIGLFVDKNNKKIPIVGVIKDFNTKSTHVAIKPLAYSSAMRNSYMIHIALKPLDKDHDSWKKALSKTEVAFKELFPGQEFKYDFFDDNLAEFYKSEQNIAQLLKWATGLCIFISCLGLLGLVIYITNTRTKEIGVRKVLGASVIQLASLLSKELVSLVLIAFIIALPLAWWMTNQWLQDFVYRTSLSWWVFAISGTGMVLIAIIILSIRTIKSAMANPVKSLRTE